MNDVSHADRCALSRKNLAHARKIAEYSPEWAMVAYFYSAYNSIRAALMADPIFSDLSALKSINSELTPDDKNEYRHHVRAKQPGFGVNQLVQMLYTPFSEDYEKLHQASIAVRYGGGTLVYPLGQIEEMSVNIFEARKSEMLVASPL